MEGREGQASGDLKPHAYETLLHIKRTPPLQYHLHRHLFILGLLAALARTPSRFVASRHPGTLTAFASEWECVGRLATQHTRAIFVKLNQE